MTALTLAPGQGASVTQAGPAGGTKTDHGHSSPDAHADGAVVADLPPAIPAPLPRSGVRAGADVPDGQSEADHHECVAVGDSTSAEANAGALPKASAPRLADPLLALLADSLDDLERTRIATENRLRQLTRSEVDSDGEERGFGLTESNPQVRLLTAMVDSIKTAEHSAELALKRSLRSHALGPWVKATVGIGEKQGARLLAAVGDPYWNTLHDRPRTVSELWAYCGYHVLPVGQALTGTHCAVADGSKHGDPGHSRGGIHICGAGVAASRQRGQRANWSATAKMRAFLVAESCMKQAASPYRAVYDAGREKYADATHPAECRRCGPKGKPAPVGSPLSLGHQHARALRLVSKAILRDLWIAARDAHEEATA